MRAARRRQRRYIPRYRWRSLLCLGLAVALLVGISLLPLLLWHTIQTTPPPTPTPAKLTLGAGAHSLGIATGGGLAYEPSANIASYMQATTRLGAQWVRFDIDWNDIQQAGKTKYSWSRYDQLVKTAAAAHLHVLGIITYTPPWARAASCATSYKCPPKTPDLYAQFARQVAARYAPQGVHTWELWNEPNRATPQISAPTYVAMVKAASSALKVTDAQSFVVSGGLARAMDSTIIPPEAYLTQLYAAGMATSVDAVAIHPYTYPFLPNAQDNLDASLVAARQVMAQYGDGAKQLWITEFGAPSNGPGLAATNGVAESELAFSHVSETLQSSILSQAFIDYAKQPNMGPFFWFNLQDSSNVPSDPENFFGLLRSDGAPKPAYAQLQKLLKKL